MSAIQMSQAIHQIRAQMELDRQWMTTVEQEVTNHAELIDESRKLQKLEMTRTKAVLQQNDNELKDLLNKNDTEVKSVIEVTARESATRIQGVIDAVKVDVARLQTMCEQLAHDQTPGGESGHAIKHVFE